MKLSAIAAWILSGLLMLTGLVFSVALSLFLAFEAAKVVPQPGVLMAVVLCVFFPGILLTAWLVGRLKRSVVSHRKVLISSALTALFGLGLYLGVLRPMGNAHIVPAARANTQYWKLATGSRIAYSLYEPPAGVPVRPEPIIFVHGGPGLRAFDTDHTFYRQFTEDGFRVYLFDQAGSGLSDELPHAANYTVERFVADLEEIRQQVGAERVILIGHSWGGALAAHYAVAYPQRVAKLIFHSPGPLWNVGSAPLEMERTDASKNTGLPPAKILAAIVLSHASWNAAEELLSQGASGDWQAATMDPGELVCKGERSKLPTAFSAAQLTGVNLYPLLAVNRELNDKAEMDIHARLGTLRVPAIALESQCDFIPWSQQLEYKAIPGLQEFYFPDAGHFINFSQPEKLAAVIHSFLLDQPPPFAAYRGDQDPRSPVRP